jgi:threonine synthase
MEAGIWKNKELFDYEIKPEFRFTLNEGETPLELNKKLASEVDCDSIFLKREDQNPSGSQKDRYISFALSAHLQDSAENNTEHNFVISSSGNAAISAIRYFHSRNSISSQLFIYISNKIETRKLHRIISELPKLKTSILLRESCTLGKISIKFSETPLSDSIKFARSTNSILLRGSTDKYATQGFRTITKELENSLKEVDSIFIPCSSGTTVAGIYEGFSKIGIKKENIPPFHIIQTSSVHPIAQKYDHTKTEEEMSIAQAIVDRVAHRKTEIERIIKDTKGYGWIISNIEIEHAQYLLKKHNVECSNEGALTIAAIIKAKDAGLNIHSPLCIITGRK